VMVETKSIETEVGTETGKGGETGTAMTIVMIPVLRERVTSGMEKGEVTTGMTGGEKSVIESDVWPMVNLWVAGGSGYSPNEILISP
jgi:hypothetical protein